MRRLVAVLLALLVAALPVARTEARPDAQAPRLLAHYMAWYQAPPYGSAWGWHWTMNRFDPSVQVGGRRQIASHTYPAIGPYDSRDPNVAEYHALLMKVGGLDGIVVDWYGASGAYDYPLINAGTERIIAAARRAGLAVAICYEDRTLRARIDGGLLAASNALAAARADLDAARTRWMDDPSYLTLDGRPVVFAFGPLLLRTSAEWEAAFAGYPVAPVFISQDTRIAPAASGAFPWPPMWASERGTLTTARLNTYLDAFYGQAASWPVPVAGAFPGFHDIYAEAGLHASYGFLDARGGATFRETLDRALRSGAPLVQIATWNDFGEGTAIEPTLDDGARDLDHLRSVVAARRDHPYAAADLALPRQIYDARKRHAGDAAARVRIDEAAARLVEGDPAEARRLIGPLVTTADASGAPPVRGLRVRPGGPGSRAATIEVSLADAATVRLAAYDLLGREIARLLDGPLGAGPHTVALDTGTLAPGVYVVRLIADGKATSATLVVPR